MEYVECRTHDTICIGERIQLIVLERQRDSVTLAVVATLHSDVRFAHDDLRGEPIDGSHTRYLLPLLTGDCFTVDDIRVGVGLYLDRHEIAANDDCDIQLQISRLQTDPQIGRAPGDRQRIGGFGSYGFGGARAGGADGRGEHCRGGGNAQTTSQFPAEREGGIQIRCLRAAARQDGERGASCSL